MDRHSLRLRDDEYLSFVQTGLTSSSLRRFFMSIKYTPDHEWIKTDGAIATVGITHHAQDALGDVVFVDLPEVGKTYAAKVAAAVVESVKAAADVYMPVNGEVTEVNEALRDDPSLANSDPLGAGWFFKVKMANPSELDAMMDETSYASFAADSH
jgi:glycine cleavage system H protein